MTAEAALVLPLIAALSLTLVWMVSMGIAQVRTVDAARDAARALARGEDQSAVEAAARRTAPEGAVVQLSADAPWATASVKVRAEPPGWLLVPLPAMTLGSKATVQVESDVTEQ